MDIDKQALVDSAARHFDVSGVYRGAIPYGSGHINDTYKAVYEGPERQIHVILQRINHQIFRDPVALMNNIQRVTAHVAAQVKMEPDSARRSLTLIPAQDGQAWHLDAHGNYWRAYYFIPNARTYDTVESAKQAYEAARTFGKFQKYLASLPAPRLHDTIPDFHNTPRRLRALKDATRADAVGRAGIATAEIAFVDAREGMASALLDAGLPERVTHNDTKINNVMMDEVSGEGLCVIDLDTVMPGLAPYDFGDLVRTATSHAQEDELDLSKVSMQLPMYEALLRGYLSTAGEFLTWEEKQCLALAGKLITFEIGVRFLTDYLAGDLYFKVHRPGQNLDRCRTQFRLVESIEQQEERMQDLLWSIEQHP